MLVLVLLVLVLLVLPPSCPPLDDVATEWHRGSSSGNSDGR